jgi:hypothetical protein
MDQSTSRMLRREFLSQSLTAGAAAAAALSLAGCGTLLHRERLNQPQSRDLDWKIVALNGLGLIFFFIPGIIAFVVDFHTGAIYLPPHGHAMKPPLDRGSDPAAEQLQLAQIAVASEDLNLMTIEREVTRFSGSPVVISETSARVTQLQQLDQFTSIEQRHRNDRTFGFSPKRFFLREQVRF